MPWMHLNCREKADSYRGASALLTACYVLSEVLQTRPRTKEAQHTSGFSPTWPQDGWPGAETPDLGWPCSGDAAGNLTVDVVSWSSRSIR